MQIRGAFGEEGFPVSIHKSTVTEIAVSIRGEAWPEFL